MITGYLMQKPQFRAADYGMMARGGIIYQISAEAIEDFNIAANNLAAILIEKDPRSQWVSCIENLIYEVTRPKMIVKQRNENGEIVGVKV